MWAAGEGTLLALLESVDMLRRASLLVAGELGVQVVSEGGSPLQEECGTFNLVRLIVLHGFSAQPG